MAHRSARNAELAALRALQDSVGATFLDFKFDRGLTGSVTVSNKGNAVGAWWFDEDGRYKFARIAWQRSHVTADTPEAVVSRTLSLVTYTDIRA